MSENSQTSSSPSGEGSRLPSGMPLGTIDNGNGGPAGSRRRLSSERVTTGRARISTANVQRSPITQSRHRAQRLTSIAQEPSLIPVLATITTQDNASLPPDGFSVFFDEDEAFDHSFMLVSPPGQPSPMLSGATGPNHFDDLDILGVAPLDAFYPPVDNQDESSHGTNAEMIEKAERILIMLSEETIVRAASMIFSNWGWAQRPQTRAQMREMTPPEVFPAFVVVIKRHVTAHCDQLRSKHEATSNVLPEEGNMCVMCLSPIVRRVKAITQCGHKFCIDCLVKWLETCPNGDCPMCRTQFNQAPRNWILDHLNYGADSVGYHAGLAKGIIDELDAWEGPRWPNPVPPSPPSRRPRRSNRSHRRD